MRPLGRERLAMTEEDDSLVDLHRYPLALPHFQGRWPYPWFQVGRVLRVSSS